MAEMKDANVTMGLEIAVKFGKYKQVFSTNEFNINVTYRDGGVAWDADEFAEVVAETLEQAAFKVREKARNPNL